MNGVFLDWAVFYNAFDDLLSLEPGSPAMEDTPFGARTILPIFLRNGIHGSSYGFELAVVGRNLIEDQHREFAGGTQIERSVFGQTKVWW